MRCQTRYRQFLQGNMIPLTSDQIKRRFSILSTAFMPVCIVALLFFWRSLVQLCFDNCHLNCALLFTSSISARTISSSSLSWGPQHPHEVCIHNHVCLSIPQITVVQK
mmetsp:Transcript_5964/g.8813  ORF Transcript_5964/g.8813 Transcript_5964/m.8813 type:complete len:108 (-) Transcript_5964:23-346(-)